MALVVWVGAVVFVSLVVAPVVFGSFPVELAGTVMAGIFPVYYGVTAAAGVVALAAALVLWRLARGSRAWTAMVVMLAIMLAATTYAGGVVHPRARALRLRLHQQAVEPEVQAEFDLLHRRAVRLNGVVLLLGLATVAVAANSFRFPSD